MPSRGPDSPSARRVRREAHEAGVEGPVVLHRPSEIVRRALGGVPPVIDALTLVGDPARDLVPDLRHEGAGALDGVARIVDEPGLDGTPAILVAPGPGIDRRVAADRRELLQGL